MSVGGAIPTTQIDLLRGDPAAYDAAGDMEMVRRIGALSWLLSAVLAAAMLPVWPPTAQIGAAGWAVVAVGLGLRGLAISQRGRISLRVSFWVTLADIAFLSLLAWLSGVAGHYTVLIVVAIVFLGASQAPRRVGAGLGLAAVAVWAPLFDGHLSTATATTAAVNLIIWTVLSLLALVWTAGVRWQRLALQQEREHANHLALHDPVTGLGNRRKLLLELEEAVSLGEPALLALFDLNGFKAYNDSFGHPAGDALLARLGAKLGARGGEDARAYRMGGDEFCLLARGGEHLDVDLIAIGRVALREQGNGFMITAAAGIAMLPEEACDPVDALRLADRRMYADKHERRGQAATDGAEMLLAILQERDPALADHACAVAGLAGRIAARMGIVEPELGQLIRAAQLHDIGKLAVPDAIVGKPGPLDESEWSFMRRHTLIGERVTSISADLEPAARIIRASHERVDGSGYPDGLQGDEIPLAARIVAVCDAYDAMSSDRAYRTALPPEQIQEELRSGAGSQFDPAVVAMLLEILAEEREGPASSRPAQPDEVGLEQPAAPQQLRSELL